MKLKDVMIGDWALDKENDCPWQINIKDFRNDGNNILFFEPIPLTSELLERNSFERVPQPGCANPYHWMLEKYEEETDGLLYRIKAYDTQFRGMFVNIDNPSCCETISFGKQIEFVHEFQHALRLCEIEFEIKLKD